MATASDKIIEKIQRFLHGISASGLHVERAMLFGSYTKGTANTWSDIDVAIVSKDFTGVGFYESCNLDFKIDKTDTSKLTFCCK